MLSAVTIEQLLDWLSEVKDPEIPVLSLIDLGVITNINVLPELVRIEMTPTFVGCPAMEVMKEEIKAVLFRQGVRNVDIVISFREPWTSDRISEKGKKALKEFGLAPPTSGSLIADLDVLETATCPRCNSENTELKSVFGTTLCRSIYYCCDCRETFEQFKSV